MRKPSAKFWWLTQTMNQVLRLVILKTIFRKKKKRNKTTTAAAASLSRS